MADGGGWHSGFETGEATGLARDRFQAVLSEFAQRLTSPEPMRRETAVALVQQLDRLGRRIVEEQETALARAAELDAAVLALTARLEAARTSAAARETELSARIDSLLAELGEARAAKRPAPIRTIVAAVAACVALGGAAAGVVGLTRPPPEPRAAAATLPVVLEAPAEPPVQPMQPPVPAAAEIASPPVEAAPPPPRDAYPAVAAALARGAPDAVVDLTRLALTGNADAQLRLAQAYEAGDHGLPRDLAAARLWTLKAAARGDRVAMYNAGQFLMEGDGGPKDPAAAADWFRRAAQKGVVDAQYNLGLMYETGQGVARDPREAQKWYARAGQAGDATARQKQAELERRLDASGPQAPAAAAADAGVRGASVGETQAYLSQQGYYIGPVDGVVTPELRAAADAYMKDHPAVAPTR